MDNASLEVPSPFHPGEIEAQTRMGVREKIDRVSGRRIRDYMPDQHREFYAMLPFILAGTVDEQGQPWASVLAGQRGFISSPNPRRLDIAARPLPGDPLSHTLKPGADIGLLGLQLETRRRNRISGQVRVSDRDTLSIDVRQAFGNCPQYIQTRAVEVPTDIDANQADHPITVSDGFDGPIRDLIERSDTLFIATAYTEGTDAAARGADVSHRGGKPGFVRAESDRSFIFPDFSGNLHFNTVGNILMNPKTGFLFIDFDTGDLIYMTGRAEIVWDGDDLDSFTGAERLVRFHATQVMRVGRSLPIRFEFNEYSPVLERTGQWS